MNEDKRIVNTLECILFAAKEPVPVARLAEALEQEATDIPRLLEQLDRSLAETGIQVVGLAGGYTLATRPEYADAVQRFLEPDPERLSVQALETLAIIAYNQPLTRPEIDEIRGVNSSGAVNSLIEKGLVRVAGRKDAPGRPFLLETTPHFLSVFGLKDLADLPAISSLRQAMEEQMAAQVAAPEEASAGEAGDIDDGVEAGEDEPQGPLAVEKEHGDEEEPDQ
ncbi:MAG: SMC-Scp complex subunit ScpB [Armatimonadetes bacterium]|nr:SMC-Scp complex subunit ScpB [Armatimonadota bacterium]